MVDELEEGVLFIPMQRCTILWLFLQSAVYHEPHTNSAIYDSVDLFDAVLGAD